MTTQRTQILLGGFAWRGDAQQATDFVKHIEDMQSYLSEQALRFLALVHFGKGSSAEVNTVFPKPHAVEHLGETLVREWIQGPPTCTLQVRTAIGDTATYFVHYHTLAGAMDFQLAQQKQKADGSRLQYAGLHSSVVGWLFPKGKVPTQCEHKKPPRMSAKRKALVDALFPNGLPYDCPHYDTDYDIRDED